MDIVRYQATTGLRHDEVVAFDGREALSARHVGAKVCKDIGTVKRAPFAHCFSPGKLNNRKMMRLQIRIGNWKRHVAIGNSVYNFDAHFFSFLRCRKKTQKAMRKKIYFKRWRSISLPRCSKRRSTVILQQGFSPHHRALLATQPRRH